MLRSPHIDPTPRLRGRAGVEQRDRRLKRTDYLCEMCKAKGIIRLATVVDHIKPLAKGGKDIDDNTRNLCDPHHAEVTAIQFGFQRMPKRQIGADGWPIGQE